MLSTLLSVLSVLTRKSLVIRRFVPPQLGSYLLELLVLPLQHLLHVVVGDPGFGLFCLEFINLINWSLS